jgi:hypothetical protein
MKKPGRLFVIQAGGSRFIGVEPGTEVTIGLMEGKRYTAPIERLDKALAAGTRKRIPRARPGAGGSLPRASN